MITVLKTEGKGRENADFITVMHFDDVLEANKYCEDNTDLDTKYWSFAEIITPGVKLEPWYGENI